MSQPAADPAPSGPATSGGRVALSWTLVGIPLAYGIFNIVKATLPLFGG